MGLPGPWVKVGRDVLRGVPRTYMLAVWSMKLGHNSSGAVAYQLRRRCRITFASGLSRGSQFNVGGFQAMAQSFNMANSHLTESCGNLPDRTIISVMEVFL